MTDSHKLTRWSHIVGRLQNRRQAATRVGHRTRRRTAMAVLAAAALPVSAGSALVAGAAPASAGQFMSASFSFNDDTQYFVVPDGVTSVNFTVAGGSGAHGSWGTGSGAAGSGGLGASINATIPVVPGRTLVIEIGGQGHTDGSQNGGAGGLSSGNLMNGGAGGYAAYFVDGFPGGGGGGGTEIVDGTTGIPLVAAGGGGGGGGGASIVNGGGTGGNAGLPGGQGGGTGGDGGAGAAAGSWDGGVGGTPYPAAESGGAGGGGGGYYDPALGLGGGGNGGGGGGWVSYESGGGGGGGGASYLDPSASGTSFGYNTGSADGFVSLSWDAPTTTITSLTSSASAVPAGQGYELTADVSGTGTPTGDVEFTSSTGQELTAALDGLSPDLASVDVVAPAEGGAVTWFASYLGDAGDESSSSSPLAVSVLWPTTVALSSIPSVVKKGGSLAIEAAVTSASPTPPTGEVEFLPAGGTPITEPLTNGSATLRLTAPSSAGTYNWTAAYLGDSQNAPGTAAAGVTITVVGAPTISKVSPSSGTPGTPVTLTGSNLVDVSKVLFGTKAAKDVSCQSDQTCKAVAPSGVTGQVDIRVIAAGGKSALSAKETFTFSATP